MSQKSIWIQAVVVIVLVAVGYLVFGRGKATAPVATNGVVKEVAVGDSVATVNGTVISKAFYDTQLASAIATFKTQGVDVANTDTLSKIKTQVINDLINNELVVQGIAKAGIKASQDDVEKQFQAILTQAGGAEGFKAELAKNNLTEAQLRENISLQLAVQAYLLKNIDSKSITVSNDEIKQFYADYSKAQKDAGEKTVPALSELTDQIKQQITANKQQVLINAFVASLREKADVKTSI